LAAAGDARNDDICPPHLLKDLVAHHRSFLVKREQISEKAHFINKEQAL